MSLPRARKFYVPSLDGIRAGAFLLVFMAHAGLDRVVPGGLGVTIFFFLSGYLITTLLRLEALETGAISLRKFYLRRAARILPPLYITLAFSFFLGLSGVMWMVARPSAYLSAVTFCLNYYEMLPDGWLWVGPGMGVVWSLCIEEHFYLVFPLLYCSFLRRRVAPATQVKILAAGCLVALVWRVLVVFVFRQPPGQGPRWTYSTTDCRFDSILWGVILAIRNNAWFDDRREGLLARHKGWFALAGLAGLVLSLVYRHPAFRETARYTLQGISLFPIFYYCVATDVSWAIRLLRMKVLRWIGTLSYTLYLCHLYILTELRLRHHRQLVGDAAIALAMALGYAWAMNRWVESPLKRWRARLRAV